MRNELVRTLLLDRVGKHRVVEKDGACYFLTMSGGVFDHEVAIALRAEEVPGLLADPVARQRLSRAIIKCPDAFAGRMVHDQLD